jgi:hypothetical protein
MKSLKEDKDKEKDKSGQADKEGQEGSGLKTAGPEGEITAGLFCAVCYHDLLVNIHAFSIPNLVLCLVILCREPL